MEIDFKKLEKKWQEKWEKDKVFQVKEKGKKYYVLEMFPYPSASFLHMGHVRNYTMGDVFSRFKRMQGFNVLYPMGYDSFGLPAENASRKEGIHPKTYTENSIKKITEYLKKLGNSYDWSRVIATHTPEYFKWNQFFFTKFFEKGLVYRKKAPVNWCPKCTTVLADEEVEDGKCWRCESEVTIKDLEQWFFKITEYADELLKGLDKIDWSERLKTMQRNWIGKSYGTEINFEIENKTVNCVIVHGVNQKDKEKIANGEPLQNKRHWIPWIKKELEKKEIEIKTPSMPESWNPKYDSWKKELEKININENSILIGHSAGGGFLIRWLGETKKKIKKLILVAPAIAHSKEPTPFENLLRFDINPQIKDIAREIIILISDNERDSIKKSVEIISEKLGVATTILKNKGHFTEEDMGTKEFLELLDKIISNEKWKIFTTRPDTIYGVTFMVISSQHPKLFDLVTKENKNKVEEFLKKLKLNKEEMEKEGVFTGSYAVNPLTKEKVPVYAGNFVVADYGSGMVMAVPAHDSRDFDFAKKYKIPIKEVIKGGNIKEKAYVDEGILINSGNFSGLKSKEAIEKISDYIEKQKLGKKTVNYKIRDWLISRQRYWGTPIPMIYCKKCGIVPVPEKDLPVLLPEDVKFGDATNPILSSKKFQSVKCPKCGKQGKRETDTMGGFMDSSWYFLRYCDPKNSKEAFDKKKVEYWMPVDQYIGGIEHAVGHLMYSRFFTKALKDMGFVKFDEPFLKLLNQGIVYKDGAKMSKSKGNIVTQDDIASKYGIDTARLFLMFVASPEKQMEWADEGIEGSFRIINKIASLKDKIEKIKNSELVEHKVNLTIKKVTENIASFEYPKAIISIIELVNGLDKLDKKSYESILKIFSPFCPHITEELWEKIGNKSYLSLEAWPVCDEKKINLELEKQEESIEKLANDINNIVKLVKDKGKEAKKAYIYCIPKEIKGYTEGIPILERKTNLEIEVFAVNDKVKYDPENKSGKAKLGKPAVYLE